jgi:tRNA pseudouridine55 synthase
VNTSNPGTRTRPPSINVDGILLVDKPQDWTSHDVVNCIRGRFRLGKVGHCGTLDPLATGLLVVVLGRATKLAEQFSGADKTYAATLRIGTETDSQDSTGKVIAEHDWSMVTPESVRTVFSTFLGPQLQMPPMVSAIKRDGQPLYKLARQGREVEREARPIVIQSIEITRLELPDVDFIVTSSKGTYVRTLCSDIGAKLGCGGLMSALRRVRSGQFSLADGVVTMEQVKSWTLDELMPHIRPCPSLD